MQTHFIIGEDSFPLVSKTVFIGKVAVPIFQMEPNPQNLDRITQIRGLKEGTWPYWLEEWPVTYALARHLSPDDPGDHVAHADPGNHGGWALPEGPILDLGCGSGFLAAFFKIRFGRSIFSCDFNIEACRLARLNETAESSAELKSQGNRTVFCADFNAFPSRQKFALILGGDLLYSIENQDLILNFLHRHLALDGRALFADPGRSSAAQFPALAQKSGFNIATHHLPKTEGLKQALVHQLSHGRHG